MAAITQPASVAELADASAQDLAPISGTLSVSDLDIGNTFTASISGTPTLVWSGGSLTAGQIASLTTAMINGHLSFTSGVLSNGGAQTIGYTYDAAAANLDFLAAGQTLTIGYAVQVSDGTATTATQPLNFVITGTNDAPVLDAARTPLLGNVNTSIVAPSGAVGTLVSSLVDLNPPVGGLDNVTDADTGAVTGIALTATLGTGTWFYSINNGSTWTAVGAVTSASGLLLSADANTRLYYASGTAGTVTSAITFRAWDQTTGTAGNKVTTATNGGTTAFSSTTDTANVTVIASDTTPPSVSTITASANLSNLINGATGTITITFSEIVTNFTVTDISVQSSRGTLSNFTAVNPDANGNSIQYTALFTKTSNGAVKVDIAAGSYNDLAGNTGSAFTTNNPLPAGVSGEAINLALTDPTLNHNDLIHLTVSGVPAGWSLNQGILNVDGTWSIDTYDPSALSVTSATGFAGAIVLSVNASWTNIDGTTSTMQTNDNVEVFAKGSPIFALSGDDHLTGSSGDDFFVLSTPIGNDTIHSFDVAHDKIDLIGFAGFASFADVQAHLSQDAAGNALITLANGQTIDLLGVSAASLNASNFTFNIDPVTDNAGSIVISDGAIMPYSGVLNNTGTLTLDAHGTNTELEVIQHGLTLQGGGKVVLSDYAGNGIFAAISSVALTNLDNTISGAGQLGEGQMTLVNEGTIIASGTNALVIDTGTNIIINSGTLEATGTGGLVINSSVENTGLLWANAANITVNGDVTGGSATLGGAAMLELAGNSSVNVAFVDASAQTLQIDGVHQFAGTVTGLGSGDSLDFSAFNNTAAVSYAENANGLGGVLSITEGADTLQINLVGHYIAPDFVTTYDTTHGLVVQYHDGLLI